MQEVTIRLRFNRECLGYAKGQTRKSKVIYRMPRDSHQRVMFLPSWWRSRFRYAATVVGRCGNMVKQINWDPIVDGNLSEWKRTIKTPNNTDRRKRPRYALHEAFRPGDMIGINAVLPAKMSLDDFTELLTVVGTYKGISPFQDDEETYGTFEVVSVHPTVRSRAKPEEVPASIRSEGA